MNKNKIKKSKNIQEHHFKYKNKYSKNNYQY